MIVRTEEKNHKQYRKSKRHKYKLIYVPIELADIINKKNTFEEQLFLIVFYFIDINSM